MLFQIFVQVVTVGLAFLTISLDYDKSDKRTKAFKKRKRLLPLFLGILLFLSISATIIEYLASKEEQIIKEKQIEEERNKYENQIQLLIETNSLASETIDSVKSLLTSANQLHSSLYKSTSQLLGHYNAMSKKLEEQKNDLTNNVLALNFIVECIQYRHIKDSIDGFAFVPLQWSYQMYLMGFDEKRNIDLAAHYFEKQNNISSPVSSSSQKDFYLQDSTFIYSIKRSPVSVLFKNPTIQGMNNIQSAETVSLSISDEWDNLGHNYTIQIKEAHMIIGGNKITLEPKFPDSLYKYNSSRTTIHMRIIK